MPDTIRKFARHELEVEPHDVRFKDLYPWDAIADTPFGASLAVVEPRGRTVLHSHTPAETFVICRGSGTMTIDQRATQVAAGDVIYNPPHSVHQLVNDSSTEDLVFVSVFWDASGVEPHDASRAPRLILPSPPTSNGPLHLGHLSGPYLIADVIRRYYRARGTPARFVCLMDEHQSYVLDRAVDEATTAGEIATRYSEEAAQTLAQFHAAPDECIYPTRDAAYRAAVRDRFVTLLRAGRLETRELATWFCAGCDLSLYDSFVAGRCPHCGADCAGFICEACSAPNQTTDLVDAVCDRCRQPPSVRVVKRLVFPLAPYAARLGHYHERLRASPKLRRLAAQWLAQLPAVPASQVSTWGLPVDVEGFEGQVISPWFEVALAVSYLKTRHAPGDGELLQFFGYDNAFLYLIHDPAVSLALDPEATLPRSLVANEFLLLDDAKMSTSRSHALRAQDALAQVPADLLRLYLAKIRPEDARTSMSLAAGQMYLTVISQHWQSWLARLGDNLAAETGSLAPEPSPAASWSAEQTELLHCLKDLLRRARRGYETSSLKEVTAVIHELADRASSFGAAQTPLAGIPSLSRQRMTGLVLELAALKSFVMIVAPVMPVFAERLWVCLGYDAPVEWFDEVEPIAAGQPIDTAELIARRFFPAAIGLASSP
jgi:methionyl-tRNA synthetase